MKSIFKTVIIEKMAEYQTLNVAVHDGGFHADDVFSICLLKRLCAEAGVSLNIVRTRDCEKLAAADMRVDVGGRHNPETLDFDHHQRGDKSLEQENGIKHAAIGLLAQWCMEESFLNIFREKYLFGLEYQDNNGRSHEKYSSIGFCIQPFLPAYGQKEDLDELFWKAVSVAEIIFDRAIKTAEGILQCEEELPEATEEVLANGKILVLNRFMPLQPFLHQGLCFTIVRKPKDAGFTFSGLNGHLIKPEWRGFKGEDLAKACGFEGEFTHPAGFTGTMKTLEGAKALCLASL